MPKTRKPEDYKKPCMTITFPNQPREKIEIFMLNVGEGLDRFGGSSHGLTVKGTASCVTRHFDPASGISDHERDIYDPNFWEWIARLINDGGELKVHAITDRYEIPPRAASEKG